MEIAHVAKLFGTEIDPDDLYFRSSSKEENMRIAKTTDELPASTKLPQERSQIGHESIHHEPIHLVSVGRIEPNALIRDALPDAFETRVLMALDYRELWNSPVEQPVHLVLIHNSLCTFEVEEAAHLVRGRWPRAKILLIRSGEISLADALYDERLIPPVNPLQLLSSILRLIAASDERQT